MYFFLLKDDRKLITKFVMRREYMKKEIAKYVWNTPIEEYQN